MKTIKKFKELTKKYVQKYYFHIYYQTIWLFEPHQINYIYGGPNKKDFHEEIIQGNPIQEQIYVPAKENYQINFLCFVGKS